MNQYEELIYSLIANCNREITKEEKKILNQASAIYNTYNNLTDELGCPLEVAFKALEILKRNVKVSIDYGEEKYISLALVFYIDNKKTIYVVDEAIKEQSPEHFRELELLKEVLE